MPKRFTETEKWNDPWFSDLDPKMKLAWLYFLDVCDSAGIVQANFRKFAFDLGFKITRKDIDAVFKERVAFYGDKFLIKKFFEFQYKDVKNQSNVATRARQKIDSLIKSSSSVKEQSLESSSTLQELEIITEQEEEKDTPKIKFDFDAIYKAYPRKDGKAKGLEICKRQIKTQKDFEDLSLSVKKYAHLVRDSEKKFIKHFSTFMGCWRDYVELEVDTRSVLEKFPEFFEGGVIEE